VTTLKDCTWPWSWLVVDAAGYAHCCCHSRTEIGNVADQTIDEIWNGQRMRRLREAIAKDEFHQYCKGAACLYSLNSQARIAKEGGILYRGLTINFRDGGNSLCYTTGGWSIQEEDYTWTIGPQATLQVAKLDGGVPHHILVRWRALRFPKPPQQAVEILFGGQRIGRAKFTRRQELDSRFRIPWRLRRKLRVSPLELAFRISYPRSPQSYGVSADDRPLGVAVSSIHFM
jgi:hypothetical protein